VSDTRRFDSLERVVRDTRRLLDDTSGTVLARLGTHTHDEKAPLNLDAQIDYVGTLQTTTSTTYVDLTTVGPTCVLTLPAARRVLVFIKAQCRQTTTTPNRVYMSVALTGATVGAAPDLRAVSHNGNGQGESYASVAFVDCVAGTTTFTAKYRVVGGTGEFSSRTLVVIPV